MVVVVVVVVVVRFEVVVVVAAASLFELSSASELTGLALVVVTVTDAILSARSREFSLFLSTSRNTTAIAIRIRAADITTIATVFADDACSILTGCSSAF